MQAIAEPVRVHPGARAAKALGVASIARLATIVGAFVIAAVLIGGIVAASLGLGAEGHSGVGLDRPPPPEMTSATPAR